MDALLNNADVDQIWCEPLECTLVRDAEVHRDTLEPSKKPYAVLTLTDGTHVAPALAFPAARLARGATGQRVRAAKHRVQWTNGRRQWFIFEGSLGAAGPPPDPASLRPAPCPAAVPPAVRANSKPKPPARKRQRRLYQPAPPPGPAAAHPFLL